MIALLGTNHKWAPIAIREKLVFPKAKPALRALVNLKSIDEGCILSTCNRVEICVASKDTDAALNELNQFITDQHGFNKDELSEYFYRYRDEEAITHTFRVVSSLDSLVVGEPQILGQVKEAYKQAQSAKALGPVLHRFYHKAFNVAKKVRRETWIGKSQVSVASVAVDLSQRIFHGLTDKTFFLIGAGEMIELAARRLFERGAKHFILTNRTVEKAEFLKSKLSSKINVEVIPFERFKNALQFSDMVIVSTSYHEYLLNEEMMKRVIGLRRQKPVFCIDLSVPRNIDPRINDIDNIYLYNVDDLEAIVKENLDGRKKEAALAERIVRAEAESFNERIYARFVGR